MAFITAVPDVEEGSTSSALVAEEHTLGSRTVQKPGSTASSNSSVSSVDQEGNVSDQQVEDANDCTILAPRDARARPIGGGLARRDLNNFNLMTAEDFRRAIDERVARARNNRLPRNAARPLPMFMFPPLLVRNDQDVVDIVPPPFATRANIRRLMRREALANPRYVVANRH